MSDAAGPVAICPSCHHKAHFHFVGYQHWPLESAQSADAELIMALWRCGHCQSSLLETNLDFLPPDTSASPG